MLENDGALTYARSLLLSLRVDASRWLPSIPCLGPRIRDGPTVSASSGQLMRVQGHVVAAVVVMLFAVALVWAVRRRDRRSPTKWRSITVIWDCENIMPTLDLLRGVRHLALELAHTCDAIRAYGEWHSSPRALQVRRMLHDFGCLVLDAPHNGQKETADKLIIFDLADLAARKHATSFLLITDDSDFSMAVARVQQGGVRVARAGTKSAVAGLIHADRTFDWDDGSFREIVGAPARVRRPRPVSSRYKPGDLTAVSLRSGADEQETLLVCQPFLMLLALFYVPRERDTIPLQKAVVELGWPCRPDGINIQVKSGFRYFGSWVSRAEELGLVRLIGSGSKDIVKGPDADYVWFASDPQWKADLLPAHDASLQAGRGTRGSRRRARLEMMRSASFPDSPSIGITSDDASSRPLSETSPEMGISTPPSSIPSSPEVEHLIKGTRVRRPPVLGRVASTPLISTHSTSDDEWPMACSATDRAMVGLRLRLLSSTWDREAVRSGKTASSVPHIVVETDGDVE